MIDFVELFANLAFPAAVAIYLLIRLEEKLAAVGDRVQRLAVAVERLEATVRTHLARR